MVRPQSTCGLDQNLADNTEFDEAGHNDRREWKPHSSNAAAAHELIFTE